MPSSRSGDDLVVDIREIPHVLDVEPLSPEVALDQIEGHSPARMAEMGRVVDRHTAGRYMVTVPGLMGINSSFFPMSVL